MPGPRAPNRAELLLRTATPIDPGAGELALEGPLAQQAREGAVTLRAAIEAKRPRRRVFGVRMSLLSGAAFVRCSFAGHGV